MRHDYIVNPQGKQSATSKKTAGDHARAQTATSTNVDGQLALKAKRSDTTTTPTLTGNQAIIYTNTAVDHALAMTTN